MNKFASIAAEVLIFNDQSVNTQIANNRVDQKLLKVNVFTLFFALCVICACGIDIYFLDAYIKAKYPLDCHETKEKDWKIQIERLTKF